MTPSKGLYFIITAKRNIENEEMGQVKEKGQKMLEREKTKQK